MNSFVGGGSGNVAGALDSGVLSGLSNHACDSYSGIGAGFNNGIGADGDASQNAFIGAGNSNSVTIALDGFVGAGNNNTVTNAPYGFIGAGNANTVSSFDGFIGAGASNSNSGLDAAIVGGNLNSVSGSYASIGGGYANTVTASDATVGGGGANRANGSYATVPGGYGNTAVGVASFAAGFGAYAANNGAFVWSDATSGAPQLKSSAINQFLARASGGVKFYSNKTLTTGVMLGAGSGTWASVSDRAVKTNVAAIDDAGILDKVASLPISEWSYISEHGVRHVGPMAQDFYAAFGVGADNKHITSIDEDGVALAAIKALHSENSALRTRVAGMEGKLALKDATVSAMQHQLQKLSAVVASMRATLLEKKR